MKCDRVWCGHVPMLCCELFDCDYIIIQMTYKCQIEVPSSVPCQCDLLRLRSLINCMPNLALVARYSIRRLFLVIIVRNSITGIGELSLKSGGGHNFGRGRNSRHMT